MKRTLIIVGLVLAVVVGWVVYTLAMVGVFRSIEPHGPEPRVITGFDGGTEDVVFRPDGSQVFVSSADFGDPSSPGHIYLVDVATEEVRDVTPKLDFDFNPHGIALFAEGDTERLFVVNHRSGSGFTQAAGDVAEMVHAVEVFDVAGDGSLSLVTSHVDDALVSPNDVAPVDAERFYVTNDHGFGPGFRRTLEDWLRIPVGNVVYYDGEEFIEAWGGTRYANGIAVAPGGGTVFVAETTGGVLRALRRDPESGELFRLAEDEDYMGLDNLSIAPDGAIWAAAHPKLLAFTAHAEDRAERSPSQVIRFEFDGEQLTSEEIYLNDGDPMSGSSIAATNGDVVVVGAVFESKLLVWDR
jgi:arylesterase/paraoxonase